MASLLQGICSNLTCSKPGVLTCARCKVAKYCSKACQKKHWKLHKMKCKPPPPAKAPPNRNAKKQKGKARRKQLKKSQLQKTDLELEIEKLQAEMAAATKIAEEARAKVERETNLYNKAKMAHDKVKKQEDEAKLNMDKAMQDLRQGGFSGSANEDNAAEAEDANGASDNSQGSQPSAPDYGKKDYWEKRYSGEQTDADLHVDDWYLKFSDLKTYLANVPRDGKPALDVGCGTSKLCEELIKEGKFKNVYGIDFSYNAINTMKERDEIDGLNYMVMDATNMHFEDNFFSCALDKGTIDAVMSGKMGLQTAKNILLEVYRVLSSKGVFVVVSSIPQLIYLGMLESAKCDWKIEYHELKSAEKSDVMSMWVYTLTKN